MKEPLDVTIVSSCRPCVERCLESFLSRVSCSRPFRFLAHIDVCGLSYLSRLRKFLAEKGINDISVRRVARPGAADRGGALETLLPRLRSPFFFHLEDDRLILAPIDLDPVLALMEENVLVDQVRFSSEPVRPKVWLSYLTAQPRAESLKDNLQVHIGPVPLVKTFGWSFDPSLNRTETARSFAGMGGQEMGAETYCSRMYDARSLQRGTYIYGSIGDSARVRDMGTNRAVKWFKRTAYALSGGKYPEYRY